MQGNQEEETESQQLRVSHPSEAGKRIKEPGGKQKVNNKESVTLEGESRNPRGKQKVNNKESVTLEGESRNPGETESQQQKESATPESYLSIYLSIYLTVYLSISLSIKEPMGTWKNGTSTTKSPSRNLNATLKKPQSNTK